MNQGLRFGLAALISLAAVWAGAEMYLTRFAPPAEHGVPVPVGEASAPTAQDLSDDGGLANSAVSKIPQKLPDFKLADLDGRLTPVSQWRGKSLMINFWATWCAPCRREIPLLQSLHAENAGRDTLVIGVAVDYPDKVREFRDHFKIAYPLLVGEQDALDLAAALGVTTPAFPFTVFTDRRGDIVTLYLGELKRPAADTILAVVDDLNEDRVTLPAARARIAAALGQDEAKS